MMALVVDDKEENLNLLRALLSGHGYEVQRRATGPRPSSWPAGGRRTSSSPNPDAVQDGFSLSALEAGPEAQGRPLLLHTAPTPSPRTSSWR
jgi:CheY-like chemotaxis protein